MDPNLLGRLKKLKELDLSNNLLETLPANLGLSHLRILRCTNNQLGDVTGLHQFPELEELSLEGNPFLTVRGPRTLWGRLRLHFPLPHPPPPVSFCFETGSRVAQVGPKLTV